MSAFEFADRRMLVSVLAITALVGCGTDPQEQQSRSNAREEIIAAVEAMESAINDRDAERMCTSVYAFQGSTTTKECVHTLRPALNQAKTRVKITVVDVQRAGPSRATVKAVADGLSGIDRRSRETFSLVREGGRWRVLFE